MLEHSLSVFYKARHRLTITKLDTVSPYTPAILILGIYTTDWATYKHLYTQLLTDADESFIHNLQNRKQWGDRSVCQWYCGTLEQQTITYQ